MSDLALKLIAENKKTRSTFLDLGNCGLTGIPNELAELEWLEELSFAREWSDFDGKEWNLRKTGNTGSENRISSLYSTSPVFPKLINLKKLWLNGRYDEKFEFDDVTPLVGLTELQHLNVSATRVSDLNPLVGLTGLQHLNVSSTPVSALSPLARLIGLQHLNVSNTRVIDLSPLGELNGLQYLHASYIQVNDLSPLASLIGLQQLYIFTTQVYDLSPLGGLISLQRFDVSDTQISDLSPLAELVGLQRLDISYTPVSNLRSLAGLTGVQHLNVSNTRVSDLRPLSELTELQQFNIAYTQISDLIPILNLISIGIPVKWSNKWWRGEGIYVKDCPLTNPPVEIVKQGNGAILNYFREKAVQGVDRLYEAKLLIIGEGGAGKTSLLRRLYRPDEALPEENESTKGIDIHRHDFTLKNGRNFRLNVWDFGGQEIYHATHQFFLTKRSLYVLLDDTRKDYKSVHDDGFKYWLEVVELLGDRSPVLIFQNEKGDRSKTIDRAGIKGRFDNVKDFYRGNLQNEHAADTLREAIEFYAQQLAHIGEELPAKWIDIRADLEALAEKTPRISQQAYFDIYRKHLEFDRAKALHLSEYLHDLGVFLHFQDDPLLARIVILQNQWATEAVFKVLDDEIIKAKFGHFDADDCRRLWKDSVYADVHPELLALMQKFELCYRLPDTQTESWLAPLLLPPSKPADLAFTYSSGDLILRYHYRFLPKNLISRLIVRMQRFVKHPELSWSSGTLFEQGDSMLLAEIPAQGGEIVLRARGSERKELLSVIASDLDALNETFHGLSEKIDKLIPCHCSRCITLTEPEFFERKRLLKRKKDGKLTIECPASYEEVSVLALLDGIKVERLPGWPEDKEKQRVKDSAIETSEPTIKIFLASSSELKQDRDAFDLYFRQQNDSLRKKGHYLEIVRWENCLDAMSETRLQDEYNQAVKDCDIFVSLFFTKTGKFTEEEFDTAHRQFKETGKPLIYTFFKNAPVNSGEINDEIESLLQFKEKLKALEHFKADYRDAADLKLQFKDQLDELFEKGW